MSNNTRDLQKKAAALFVQGRVVSEISKALGVKENTVLRWRCHPYFLEQLELHKMLDQQEEELRTLRLAKRMARDAEIRMIHSHITTDSAIVIANLLDKIKKFEAQGEKMLKNQLKSTQNQRKSARIIPKSAGISAKSAGISTESARHSAEGELSCEILLKKEDIIISPPPTSPPPSPPRVI